MSNTQYVEPNVGSFTYDVRAPSNFGESYAAGIGAAGKSISDAISSLGNQYLENRNVDDSLAALTKTGVLKQDEYDAVAGKSTAAKQQVLGLYAGQWIADQAAQRQVALQKGAGNVEIGTSHAKLLDTIAAIQGKYGPSGPAAAGVQPDKQQMPSPQQPQQPGPTVGPKAPGNMILKPGVKFGQMTGPNGEVIKGWQMPDGTFRPM